MLVPRTRRDDDSGISCWVKHYRHLQRLIASDRNATYNSARLIYFTRIIATINSANTKVREPRAS